jgi:hypothetical protein
MDYPIWLNSALNVLNWHQIYNFKLKKIPSDDSAFGVFTTIKRRGREESEFVHGCIGRWSYDFKAASYDNLTEWMRDTSFQASFKDNRRHNFKEPLIMDNKAILTITFLMLPLMLINTKSGEIIVLSEPFDNEKYGLLLIYTTSSSSGVTYLPKVFDNIKWNDIKTHLLEKGGRETDNVKFYAYKSIEIEYPINSLFTNKLAFQYYWIPMMKIFKNFIIKTINEKGVVIYEINAQGDFSYEINEIVRNLAVLSTIFKINEVELVDYSSDQLKKYIDLVKKHSREKECLDDIEIANLVITLKTFKMKIPRELQKEVVKYINDWQLLEPLFTLGQMIIAFSCLDEQYYKSNLLSPIFDTWRSEMIGSGQQKSNLQDIFKLNWMIQAMSRTKSSSSIHTSFLLYLDSVIDREILPQISMIETNYLAVAFEASSFSNQKKLLIPLMTELQQRLDVRTGTFKFINNSARMDISGHVYNGLLHLFEKT